MTSSNTCNLVPVKILLKIVKYVEILVKFYSTIAVNIVHIALYIRWWRSVVVSALALINVVNRHWARLVLGWVTPHGQVNHLGI